MRDPRRTRMLKVLCRACGYTLRTTGFWLASKGAPLCPCNSEPMDTPEYRDPWAEEEDERNEARTLTGYSVLSERRVRLRVLASCGRCRDALQPGEWALRRTYVTGGEFIPEVLCFYCADGSGGRGGRRSLPRV